MADHLSPDRRSANMRAIPSKGTKPELLVRKVAHRLGLRFRLHRNDLPGSPDLVFPRFKATVFVHGCFWHAHTCKRGGRIPKSNVEYWEKKISRNVGRDAYARDALTKLGWRVLVVWECEAKNPEEVSRILSSFFQLGVPKAPTG